MKLPASFYQRHDAVLIARELLGKYLFTNIGGELTAGIIVETEAYMGSNDQGSHAFNNRRTPRNEMMYSEGGVAYMYICYGIHDMLNVVTGSISMSQAVLIRAIEPTLGLNIMRARRNIYNKDSQLCQGPGALCKGFGLSKSHNGTDLQMNEIWIEDKGLLYDDHLINAAPRVGLNFEGPYKSIPWRFYVRGNNHVSRPHA